MSRTLGRLSRTTALLLLAIPAASQDDATRFPAAKSRAELQARRAWYLWSAQADPQQAVTELQKALQAAADDPARTAALNFYVAVALERTGNPEAWQKQLRQLEALGVEPYASWATEQAEAPAALPANQDPEPREIPSYLQRWAANLDDDADLQNTQEAREELRSLGVLAVPAILERLPEYGVLGLRHATELLLPHADERVLRALEQRMLGGDESALYVIATAVETLPAEPRHRLGAIALHSPSLPAAIHGAACCADVPEQRTQVLEVLGKALNASSIKVLNVAVAVLAMPEFDGEPMAWEWRSEVLTNAAPERAEALIEFWQRSDRNHSRDADERFHSMLDEEQRAHFWRYRLQPQGALLQPWELEQVLVDGVSLQGVHLSGGRGRGAPTPNAAVVDPGTLMEMAERLSRLLLRDPPLPASSIQWLLGQNQSADGALLSADAVVRYVDDADHNIAYMARYGLVRVAPRIAMERLPIGVPTAGGNDQHRSTLGELLAAQATAEDVSALLDYLQRLETANERFRGRIYGDVGRVADVVASVAQPSHLDQLLPACSLDGRSSAALRVRLVELGMPPSPETADQAKLVLGRIHELPGPAATRLLESGLPSAVDESCADAIAAAIQAASILEETPDSSAHPGAPTAAPSNPEYDRPLSRSIVRKRLLALLRHCGSPGMDRLRAFLVDPELGQDALWILSNHGNSDPIALARAVFTPPGNRALYGAFLRQPGTFGYDSSRFRALLDDSVRPHVRTLLASLLEHGEIQARPFLDALPRTERVDTCRAMIQAAVGRTDLVGAQLDLVKDALRSLGALQDPTLADTFALAFQSPSQDLRLLAIDQLASMLSPLAGPALLRALDDPDETVRQVALNALANLKSHQENKQRWQEWIERNTKGENPKDG